MRAFLGCDIGRRRGENQDSVRSECFPDGVLAIVCDGMGGMQNGSTASKIAVSAAADAFSAAYKAGMPAESICELLRNAASDANRRVYDDAVRCGLRGRTGTTLVGAFLREDCCCIVNIGDSRAYLVPAEGSIRQLTTDHTVVQLLYEQGVITAEERATHVRRNELMRAVGVAGRVLADTQSLPVQRGDRFLLCSDGLYNMLTAERLAELVRSLPPEEIPAQCIAEANAMGGLDNISVIVLTD